MGLGPSRDNAARCSAVAEPLWWPKPYSGYIASYSAIQRSRCTLARMDAAAMTAHFASPSMMGCWGKAHCGIDTASINTRHGDTDKPDSARPIAILVAAKIL